MNPYQAAMAVESTRDSRPASLIWFAATVAGLTYAHHLLVSYGDLLSEAPVSVEDIVSPILATAAYTLIAGMTYESLRPVFTRRFRFSSTPMSLVVAGVIVAGYLALFQYCVEVPPFVSRLTVILRQFYAWPPRSEYFVLLMGVLLAFPACYISAAAERLVAGRLQSVAGSSNR